MRRFVSTFLICSVFIAHVNDVAAYAGGGSRSSSSSRSSSGSRSSSSSGRTYSSGSKTYSSGKSSSSSKPSTLTSSGSNSFKRSSPSQGATTSSRKPGGTSFGRSWSSEANKASSQRRYEASTKPKATYKTPGPNGVTKPIAQNSLQVQTVRRYVTHERYVTYDNRASSFYGSYYSRPYYYQDYFSPFLMGWLLSDVASSHDRALWAYHHQSDMDQTRYNELLQKDANLQAEINQLKSQNVPVDPAYVPSQMSSNPDLMYNKEFVDASYNPVEVQSTTQEENKIGKALFWAFFLFFGVVVVSSFVHFMFIKEY